MITAQGYSHELAVGKPAFGVGNNLLVARANGQNCGLGWIDDGRELINAKHAQVADL